MKNPAKYGFTLDELEKPVAFEKVTVEKPVQLKKLAQQLEVNPEELADLNPELRHKATPPTQYSLRVPSGKGEMVYAALEKVPKYTPPQTTYVYHRVKRGETLSLIAYKYRTSIRSIVRANHLRRKHFIRVGQRLKIPRRQGATSVRIVSKEKIPPSGKYRVRKGDSLWVIARKFNTNTKTLQKINNLKTTRLYVGQILQITQ
jgi:membrane-bound lytic murein transglycosylase D